MKTMTPHEAKMTYWTNEVVVELDRAQKAFPPFNSNHEGYAVIKEELDELWGEVKRSDPWLSTDAMRAEAIQLAAMALRFLYDRCVPDTQARTPDNGD